MILRAIGLVNVPIEWIYDVLDDLLDDLLELSIHIEYAQCQQETVAKQTHNRTPWIM